jgi:hypothetical protein
LPADHRQPQMSMREQTATTHTHTHTIKAKAKARGGGEGGGREGGERESMLLQICITAAGWFLVVSGRVALGSARPVHIIPIFAGVGHCCSWVRPAAARNRAVSERCWR